MHTVPAFGSVCEAVRAGKIKLFQKPGWLCPPLPPHISHTVARMPALVASISASRSHFRVPQTPLHSFSLSTHDDHTQPMARVAATLWIFICVCIYTDSYSITSILSLFIFSIPSLILLHLRHVCIHIIFFFLYISAHLWCV